jgi:hypothetical protein
MSNDAVEAKRFCLLGGGGHLAQVVDRDAGLNLHGYVLAVRVSRRL